MTIEMKTNKNGARLFRIDNKGPWRSERSTHSLTRPGSYPITSCGVVVGSWIRSTLYHAIEVA